MSASLPDPLSRHGAPETVLSIRDLHTHFKVHGGIVKAVDGVNLTIPAGRTVGLVGESGCGKSVSALTIMRLLESNGKVVAGEIMLRDQDLLKLSEDELRDIRGNDISMIFQEPMTALNPVFSVGDQIAESVRLHEGLKPIRRDRPGRRHAQDGRHLGAKAARQASIRTSCPEGCASG